jgi:hypothetical protein
VGEPPVLTDEELLAAEPSADARERAAALIRRSEKGWYGDWDEVVGLLARHYEALDTAPLLGELYRALHRYFSSDMLARHLLARLSVVYLFHGVIPTQATLILADRDLWAGDFDPEARDYDSDNFNDRVLHLRPSADAPKTFCGLDCSELFVTERGAWFVADEGEEDWNGFLSERCPGCDPHAREVEDETWENPEHIPFGTERTRKPLDARYAEAMDRALRHGRRAGDGLDCAQRGRKCPTTEQLWWLAIDVLIHRPLKRGGPELAELMRAAEEAAAGGPTVIRRALGDRVGELPPVDDAALQIDAEAWFRLMRRSAAVGIMRDDDPQSWLSPRRERERREMQDALLELLDV